MTRSMKIEELLKRISDLEYEAKILHNSRDYWKAECKRARKETSKNQQRI